MRNKKKNIFILLILTLVFFIITLFGFFIYIHSVNDHYKVLLKIEVENLQNFQQIITKSNSNYFILNQIIRESDSNKRDSLEHIWKEATSLNSTTLNKLSDSLNILIKEDPKYKTLIQTRNNYLMTCDSFFVLNHLSDPKNQAIFFVNKVMPRFKLYQDQLADYIEYFKKKIYDKTEEISHDVYLNSQGFLLFGFSPVIFILLVVVIYFLMVGFSILYFLIFDPLPER